MLQNRKIFGASRIIKDVIKIFNSACVKKDREEISIFMLHEGKKVEFGQNSYPFIPITIHALYFPNF